jgi:NAD(P)-dependent dehydrogenase (short-subunit alcohol dehydrogenase family)
MNVAVVTGAGGVVGAAACRRYVKEFDVVVGVDNDQRAAFFGPEASTAWSTRLLAEEHPNYVPADVDIRDERAVDALDYDHRERLVGGDRRLAVRPDGQPRLDRASQRRAGRVDLRLGVVGVDLESEVEACRARELAEEVVEHGDARGDVRHAGPVDDACPAHSSARSIDAPNPRSRSSIRS